MLDKSKYKLLFKIDSPKNIRELELGDLKTLCTEIREYMVDIISETGGHFGGGLGAVDLTVALHRVFNTPYDKIIWDTGHQAYPHKIVTGRRDELNTIRKFGGLSGFLKRSESEYDEFGAGHASTSISAALGIAAGACQKGEKRKTIAVIGDGAMTGGMAYEAMNNSGLLQKDLVIVLNDNAMAIGPNSWQFANYFSEMISHPEYNKFKGAIWDLTGKLDQFGDRIRKAAAKLESGIKSIITPGMLFEALGFRYFGPINGNNVNRLVSMFDHIKNISGPVLVHTITQKGKGYGPAEGHEQGLHASTPFDKMTGIAYKKADAKPSYTSIFGNTLVEIAEQNKDVVGITAAMPDGTGIKYFQEKYPDRVYDVGIAEEHGVTFAAGLATQGVIPVVAIYSTFLQRAIDQMQHDVSLQKLHVVFVLDRAGLVGADGPTHHGVFDLTYLRMIPNMVVMAPKDEAELRDMLYTAVEYKDGPIAIRYPRGTALGVEIKPSFTKINIGEFEKIREGNDVAILAIGSMVEYAKEATNILQEENISCEVINARFAKPLDAKMLDDIAARFDRIITIEESTIVGGFGSGVLEYFNEKNYKNNILRIALPDDYVTHGTQPELHKMLEMDAEGIAKRTKQFLDK